MSKVFLRDSLELTGTRKTASGNLLVDARVARSGTQDYLGIEVGRPELDRVTVLRAEDQVFDPASMRSYVGRTVTNDHPANGVMVDTDNFRDLAVGYSSNDVVRDGEHIHVPFMVMDRETIDQIEGGKREISCGYYCDLQFGDGVTEDGVKYQAQQKNIRVNHIAIVNRGRAGSTRIGDNKSTATAKEIVMDQNQVTVMADGISVTTDQMAAQLINKLTGQLTTAQDSVVSLEAAATKAAEDHGKAMAAKDAEIDTLKERTGNLDALVADRAELLARANKLLPNLDSKGKSDHDVRVLALQGHMKDSFPSDRLEDSVANRSYLEALFDLKSNDLLDPVRDALINGAMGDRAAGGYATSGGGRKEAYDRSVASLNRRDTTQNEGAA